MGRVRRPKDLLLADVADLYVAQIGHPKTRASSREQLNWFLAHTGRAIKVPALRVHDVNGYLRKKKNWSQSTRATAVSKILAALNFAVDEGLIESHAVKFARGKRPKIERRETQVTAEHCRALEAAANPSLRAVLVALRESGCRPGEICALAIEKVDRAGRVMRVANKTAGKTGEKEREVYLSPSLLTLVVEHAGARTEGPVFLNNRGESWRTHALGSAVRLLRIKLGLPEGTVPYGLRHRFASTAINDADVNPALARPRVRDVPDAEEPSLPRCGESHVRPLDLGRGARSFSDARSPLARVTFDPIRSLPSAFSSPPDKTDRIGDRSDPLIASRTPSSEPPTDGVASPDPIDIDLVSRGLRLIQEGLGQLEAVLQGRTREGQPLNSTAKPSVGADGSRALATPQLEAITHPRFDRLSGTLWWGGQVCMAFRRTAPNQRRILDAFEEEGWPARIDDPLPGAGPGSDRSQRLGDAVKHLNRRTLYIKFGSSGIPGW